jgi:cytochrome c
MKRAPAHGRAGAAGRGARLRRFFTALATSEVAAALAFAASLAVLSPPARADAARGKTLYESRCIACHSLEANRVGPAHQGVFGRKAGSAPDYDYSPALRTSQVVWTQATLERWLANPEQLIAGQRMGYSVGEAADRADLIDYLKTQR